MVVEQQNLDIQEENLAETSVIAAIDKVKVVAVKKENKEN